MNDSKHFRVLSIDGGGTKGIVPLLWLDLLEKVTGKPVYELFDFFSGTSVGGIISLFLSQRIFTAGELLAKMLGQLKNKIFPSKRIVSYALFKESLYDSTKIEEALKDLLKDKSFKESKGNFLITASEVKNNVCNPFMFVNHEGKTECLRVTFEPKSQDFFQFKNADMKPDLKLWEIARITSAALPYFEVVKNIDGYEFLDGGFTYNNPCYLTLKYLEEKAGMTKLDNVFMLSLGCDMDMQSQSLKIDFLKKNFFQVNSQVISSIAGLNDNMNNSSYHALLLADSYLKNRLIRIAPTEIKKVISLDNVDNESISDLMSIARKMIKDLYGLMKPLCECIGFPSIEELRLLNKKSKYFHIPRYNRYPECYKSLDKLLEENASKAEILSELENFDFPKDVKVGMEIVKFKPNDGGFFSFINCGVSNNFSIATLALAVGHLGILNKFKEDIGDPFTFVEFSRWSPFHWATANGELAGIYILIEKDYLEPGTMNEFSNCYSLQLKQDLPIEKLTKLRDIFYSYKGKTYDKESALKNYTPYYYATKHRCQEILNFITKIDNTINPKTDKERII